MIIAQNKLATTTFNEEQKILVSMYKGRSRIELALEHLACIVDFYENNHVNGSLVDVSQVLGSFVKVVDFLRDSYYPAAVDSGLKIQAYVISQDLIIKNLGHKLEGLASKFGIKAAVFTSHEQALTWIKDYLKNN